MILGIDTSCYTTSVALVSLDGDILFEKRSVMHVPTGKRGLSQSEGMFCHIKVLPDLICEAGNEFDLKNLKAVGASTRPRSVAGSYMPVFAVGENIGKSIAATVGCPFFATSHQEGHLMSGIMSSDDGEVSDEFLACHFSGGTSEILHVKKHSHGFDVQVVAADNDLHAGQFIDRVGVSMGLPFPCGVSLEKLAQTYVGDLDPVTTWVKGDKFSFSGPESAIQRMINSGADPALVSRLTENAIARTLVKAIKYTVKRTGIKEILFVGGVMSNNYIRKFLIDKLRENKLLFAKGMYSSDNAFGVSCIARDIYIDKLK